MLTHGVPECLGRVKSLRSIELGANMLNSTLPSSLWNLSDLVTLNLSINYLSGHLSPEIGNLKMISKVDLSGNDFSGEIPSLIEGCQSLDFLSLSNNTFEGSIPQSLGHLRGCSKLDLSDNNLSGFIPSSLQDLHFLEYFNVSYNKLEGEIPSGGSFIHFNAESFAHNSALCGRFHVPPCPKRRKGSSLIKIVKYTVPSFMSTIILVIVVLVLIRRWKEKKISVPSDISLSDWRRISYVELEQGTSSFSETNLLKEGSFGSVYKGKLFDGLNVAVKVFNLRIHEAAKSFHTETKILSTVRHRNLVPIIGCCSNSTFKALILAYMPNASLDTWLYSDNYCLHLMQTLEIAIDVAFALEYLHHGHTFPIVHCDIKPSNVLLDQDMTARVGDFGISKLFNNGEATTQTKTLGTIGYVAPEYGGEGKVSTYGDVYSYGIMLLEMFTRKKPTDDMFSGELSLKEWVEKALLENVVTRVLAPGFLLREDQHFFPKRQCVFSIFELAMKCLAVSPQERVNMMEAGVILHKIKTRVLEEIK